MNDIRFDRVTDPVRFDVAPGFVAVHPSQHVGAVLTRILERGGAVFAALRGRLLVGYAADAPLAAIDKGHVPRRRRWKLLRDMREGVIEVARGFRRAGLARGLIQEAMSAGRLDREILIGEALVWHWDLEGEGISADEYRARLLTLASSAGFRRYATDEPEIASSFWNFLVARVGPLVPTSSCHAFHQTLM